MSINKIMLIGEAYGEEEEKVNLPFIGSSGWMLKNLLSQVGIKYDECFTTNVFNLRPKPSNDIGNLCGPKSSAIPGTTALTKGKYARAEFAPELTRLYKEIEREQPNVIIALGATAAWATLGSSGIRAIRGAPAGSLFPNQSRVFKVLPTYHPAAVSRDYTLRPIVLADLDKARRQSGSPDLVRPERFIWVEPTLDDLVLYEQEHIIGAKRLSIDIETSGDQITCIGFAPSPTSALVIPIIDRTKSGNNYWPTLRDEMIAWSFVRRWCAEYPCVFQNGLYDMHFLWRRYGIPCPKAEHDTMLLHHAQQPEMEKGLGFLGTIYTEEASWKFMRKENETVKRED